MRSSTVGARLRAVALAVMVGWSLACMLPAGGGGHHDTTAGGDEDEGPSPRGTTLPGSWVSGLECPSPMGTFDLELADDGVVGHARVEVDFEVLEFDVVVDGGDSDTGGAPTGSDASVRELVIETPGCDDCPVFEDVVWDLETLPAVIQGDLLHLVPDEPCAFSLEQTRF